MKGILTRAAIYTGVWFAGAFGFTFFMTYRLGRSSEPAPTIAWGTIESTRLKTCDDQEIGGWFVDRDAGDAPAVLFLHGVKADRRQLLGVAAEFHRRGCPVMLISQRGHGESSGVYNDFGFSCGPDVVAAVDWLRERCPGRKVVVWGTSMGAASALFAADALGDRVDGYILEAPYQNLRIAARNRTRVCLPPGVEALAYHTLNLTALTVLPSVDRISPEEAADRVPKSVPVLILAGQHDPLALPAEAQAIADRIGPSARLVIAPHGGHANLLATDGEMIQAEIDAFLSRIQITKSY